MPFQKPPPPPAAAQGMSLEKEIKVQNMLVTATELESKLRKMAAKAGVPLDDLMGGKKKPPSDGKGKGKGKEGKDGKGKPPPDAEDAAESVSSLMHSNKKTKKA